MASEIVNSCTSEVVKILEKKNQTPKVTSSPVKISVPYDPKEKLANRSICRRRLRWSKMNYSTESSRRLDFPH